jgi:hypothetical protein
MRFNKLLETGKIMIKKMLILILCSTSVMATTRYVDLNNPLPTPPYTNWMTAATSIQDAVNVASANDTVLVTNGTYSLSSEIVVTNAITIQSVNGYESTIFDAQWASRVFNLGSSECNIVGFSIIRGHSSSDGGGIYCNNSSPTIKDCLIEDCASNTQGGAANYGTFEHCTIRNNTSLGRGGGLARSVAKGCIVTDNNSGGYGGGMYACAAYSCTVLNNTSDSYGGGVCGSGNTYNGINDMIIFNSIVWYNSGANGNDISKTTSAYSCSPNLNEGELGNIILEPKFIDKTNGNYRLLSDSPCIDQGSNPYAQTTTDFDGNPRYANGQADMGAYEFQTEGSAIYIPIRVALEFSADLSTWTNTEKSVEWLLPADQSSGFYRVRSEL